ncbi:DUF488 family protein [Streptomyces sp. NPDC046821]|uniref:DUF488 domain-containing protein n=1 Tax=Streptomyces sp. NPDC046821 TaxID=3154702 RepID=UPI0033F4EB47
MTERTKKNEPHFRVRRVYDPPSPDDGVRVLVDRLWPRGVSKEKADVQEWLKELTPSAELRSWYHEDRDSRFPEFERRYRDELELPDRVEETDRLRELAQEHTVTLVTSVKDIEHSHVPVLVRHLDGD